MPGNRGDSVQLALTALRARLRDGEVRPGDRIPAAELAAALRMSPTPVREALARLAGEGLVEDRPGQGYFAPTLSGLDVAQLYRLSLAHVEIALAGTGGGTSAAGAPPEAAGADPVSVIERRLWLWVRQAGGRALVTAFRIVSLQLGAFRRLEGRLFDLEAELAALRAAEAAHEPRARLDWARDHHQQRIAAADRLAGLLLSASRDPEV